MLILASRLLVLSLNASISIKSLVCVWKIAYIRKNHIGPLKSYPICLFVNLLFSDSSYHQWEVPQLE